ncbi:hypothetical protein [Brevibacillus fulvus]|uniref:Tetratricopeptide (TPR) repeat protein n=1 Tax=Brevibacillus fulvus TaxID=1125967 RepID=A0A939BSX6_9BACL|nr:hypothetical protein [Brevibacillus fulvus]MBM7590943.1 tetratricopeptide (TPR) repeat protein [Brevibacillus fulvus]
MGRNHQYRLTHNHDKSVRQIIQNLIFLIDGQAQFSLESLPKEAEGDFYLQQVLSAWQALQQGRYEESAGLFHRILKQLRPDLFPILYGQVWHLYSRCLDRLGQREAAVSALLLALDVYRQHSWSSLEGKALPELIRLFLLLRDWHGAIHYLQYGLSTRHVELSRKQKIKAIRILCRLYKKTGKTSEMLFFEQQLRVMTS